MPTRTRPRSMAMKSLRKTTSRPPIVSTHHGVRGVPDWKMRLYEVLYRRFFLRAFDRVLCVSTEDYETVLASGIGADKLRLHLNGIDEYRVDPSRRAAERGAIRASWLPRESAPGDLFLFGVVARLSPEKDHDRLLRILARLERAAAAAIGAA